MEALPPTPPLKGSYPLRIPFLKNMHVFAV